MKKILLLLSCFFFLNSGWAQDKKLVVATASMLGDMAENIAGGEVIVKTIVPIGGDPHPVSYTHLTLPTIYSV